MLSIKALHWQHAITVSPYERQHAVRNKQEWWITSEQHQALIAYYRQCGLHYQTCDDCQIVPDWPAKSSFVNGASGQPLRNL